VERGLVGTRRFGRCKRFRVGTGALAVRIATVGQHSSKKLGIKWHRQARQYPSCISVSDQTNPCPERCVTRSATDHERFDASHYM
jgi:hypothetical protein